MTAQLIPPAVAFVLPDQPRMAASLVAPDPSWPRAEPVLEQQVRDLVNAHRATLGLKPVAALATLTASAEWKARHMAQYVPPATFSHDDPAPPVARPWYERLHDNGYASNFASENIAWGQPTPASVMDAWLQSPGHRQNIETPAWTALGVGAAHNAAGTMYWCQDFGIGADPAPPPPPPEPLQRWNAALSELAKAQQYKNWRKANLGEAARFDAFLVAPTGSPAMTTPFGRFLVATGRLIAGGAAT